MKGGCQKSANWGCWLSGTFARGSSLPALLPALPTFSGIPRFGVVHQVNRIQTKDCNWLSSKGEKGSPHQPQPSLLDVACAALSLTPYRPSGTPGLNPAPKVSEDSFRTFGWLPARRARGPSLSLSLFFVLSLSLFDSGRNTSKGFMGRTEGAQRSIMLRSSDPFWASSLYSVFFLGN